MSRTGKPALSDSGEKALSQFEKYLRDHEDLSFPTLRNYLSDLRQFIAWCETAGDQGRGIKQSFTPVAVTTSVVTRYRSFLQTIVQLKPATINRYLASLKRYFAWAADSGLIQRDPTKVVKLVDQEELSPRRMSDQEEQALTTAVTAGGTLRDMTLISLMLHTGLRAQEVCRLTPDDVLRGKRTGILRIHGNRKKYREVPLNATARAALDEYLLTLPPEAAYLFPSEKTGNALSERALGYLIKKYANAANLADVSPHCLRHRFGYCMAESVPIHRLAQIMGHESLDSTMLYYRGTQADLHREVEKLSWA